MIEVLKEEIAFCIIDLRLSYDEAMSMPRSWRRFIVEKKSEMNRKELEEIKKIRQRAGSLRRIR